MKLASCLFWGMLCMACSSKNTYVLQGKMPTDAGIDEIFLVNENGTNKDTVNRCPVESDGTFKLKGKATEGLLSVDAGRRYGMIYFYPEQGEYRLEQVGRVLYIVTEQEGVQSRLTSGFRAIYDNQDSIGALQEKLYSHSYAGDKELLRERNEELLEHADDLVVSMVKEFEGSEMALKIVYDNLFAMSFNFKFLERAVKAMGSVPASPMRDSVMKVYIEKKSQLLTGEAPDFKLPDVNGKVVSLSGYKGKYVLVDFWASWCMPCREKIKDLKKEYTRLRELGVEVVSISCDKTREPWLKAIEEDRPAWVQLIEDNKINGSDVRVDYKVQSIPRLFLVSPDGMILDVNPKIEEIKNMVRE